MMVITGFAKYQRPTHRTSQSIARVRELVRHALEDSSETALDASPAHRLEHLLVFYGQYEALIEVLCSAANYGPETKLEERYQLARHWLTQHYPEIRPFLSSFLDPGPGDDAQPIEQQGPLQDAFQFLFGPVTLEDFLRIDDGHMISRIERTRLAIDRYADHLRKLL